MPAALEGYVYVADEHEVVMTRAAPGARIELPSRSPPWIVVDHAIDSVLVARWPGKLWFVVDVDANGIDQANPNAHYTRAYAVTVQRQIPSWKLFGDYGKSVCSVIAAAAQLSVDQVRMLANLRHPDADHAYSLAWETWLTRQGFADVGESSVRSGTLAAPAPGRSRSPINCGLTVLHTTIWNRANMLVGSSAFIQDED